MAASHPLAPAIYPTCVKYPEQASTLFQSFIDLSLAQAWTELQPIELEQVNIAVLKGKKPKRPEWCYVLPVPMNTTVSLKLLKSVCDALEAKHEDASTLYLAIGEKDSSTVYYTLRSGIVAPKEVPELFQKLLQPEEPLALRLQSNLLCGIARIYQQQYNSFVSEVTHLQQAISKTIHNLYTVVPTTTTTTNDLQPLFDNAIGKTEKQPAVSNVNAITLVPDPTVAAIGVDLDWECGIDWVALGLEEPRDDEEPMALVRTSEYTPSIAGAGEHVADREAITLFEPEVEAARFMDGIAQLDGQHEDLRLDLDLGLGDEEGGFLFGQDPEIDRIIKARASADRSRTGSAALADAAQQGFASSSGQEQDYAGGMDYVDYNDYGGGGDVVPETLEERVRREMSEARAHRGPLPRASSILSQTNVQRLLDETCNVTIDSASLLERDNPECALPLGDATNKPTRTRWLKPQKAKFDKAIDLEDGAIATWRTTYAERMEQESKEAQAAKKRKEDEARAQALFLGVPEDFDYKGLSNMWTDLVTNKAFASRRKKGVATKKRSSEEREDVPLEDEVGRGADGANKHRRLDSEQVGVEAADLGGMDYVDYNDYGGGGDAGQADPAFQFDDIELGRAGDAEVESQRASLLPWNAGLFSSDIGAFQDLGGHRSSSVQHAHKASMDSSGLNRPNRSRSGSVIGSLLGSGDLVKPGSVGFELPEQNDGEEREQQSIQREESMRFLALAKLQATKDQELLFTDIIPVETMSETVASQALYQVLSLATSRHIKVRQDEPYGDIAIEIAAN